MFYASISHDVSSSTRDALSLYYCTLSTSPAFVNDIYMHAQSNFSHVSGQT
jgi:hypothetical protein